MRDDGAARFAAALARVAVLEAGLVVGELEPDPAAHGFGRVFALAQEGEVAEIALAVRAGAMGGELRGALHLQHVEKPAARDFAPAC